MTDLVTMNTQREVAVTTSLNIADKFEKNHRDVLRGIRELDCSEQFNKRNFALIEYKDSRNRIKPMYEITKDGFSFLVMGFTGSEAAEWKEKYINLFNLMEKKIYQIATERKGSDWQVSRSNGRIHRRGLTDSIAPFILYAEGQDSVGTARHAYMNFTKLVHKNCGIEARERDIVSAEMLRRLATLEGIVELKIIELMDRRMYCKEIYKEIKETLTIFVDLVPFSGEKYLPREEQVLFPEYQDS